MVTFPKRKKLQQKEIIPPKNRQIKKVYINADFKYHSY
jgi:hypothetical protein